MPFGSGVKGKGKRLVVSVDKENTALNKILKMSDSEVSRQQFRIKSTVFQFCAPEDKAVMVTDEASKLVQCFLVLGNWKHTNCFNTGNVGLDTSCAYGVAQEVHFRLAKSTFCCVDDHGQISAERACEGVEF